MRRCRKSNQSRYQSTIAHRQPPKVQGKLALTKTLRNLGEICAGTTQAGPWPHRALDVPGFHVLALLEQERRGWRVKPGHDEIASTQISSISGGSNQFISDRPPSTTIAAPVT
jgi:hypothetical protein